LRPFEGTAVTVHGVHLTPQPFWPVELWRCWEVRFLLGRLRASPIAHGIIAGDFNALTIGDPYRREADPAWVRAQGWLQAGATPH
jgi:hypothetical protein